MGFGNGENDGILDGRTDGAGTSDIGGENDGISDSFLVGELEDSSDGVLDGMGVLVDGFDEGAIDGTGTGDIEGDIEGNSDRLSDGSSEGLSDGVAVGLIAEGIGVLTNRLVDGLTDGLTDGLDDGLDDGGKVSVRTGGTEGNAVGVDESGLGGIGLLFDGRNEGGIVGIFVEKNDGFGVCAEGRKEGIEDILGGSDGTKDMGGGFASWVGLTVTIGEGAGVSTLVGNNAVPIKRPMPVIKRVAAKATNQFFCFHSDGLHSIRESCLLSLSLFLIILGSLGSIWLSPGAGLLISCESIDRCESFRKTISSSESSLKIGAIAGAS